MGSEQTPDTPAVTESLRDQLVDAAAKYLKEVWPPSYGPRTSETISGWCVEAILPIIEAELQKREAEHFEYLGACADDAETETEELIQKHTEGKARLVGEFRRLAAQARASADALPRDHFSRPMKYEWVGTSNTYLHAAQMLEESKP